MIVIKILDNFKKSSWSGGETTELYIYPENAIYKNQDFDFRVSSATVNVEQSDFTKLINYNRYIMILEGNLKLVHEDHHTVVLNKFDVDYFSGAYNTKSYGTCVDFNLMLKDNIKGNLFKLNNSKFDLNTNFFIVGFYFLESNIITTNNTSINIKKNQLVLFDNINTNTTVNIDNTNCVVFYVSKK